MLNVCEKNYSNSKTKETSKKYLTSLWTYNNKKKLKTEDNVCWYSHRPALLLTQKQALVAPCCSCRIIGTKPSPSKIMQ